MSLYAIGDLHLHFTSELKAPGQLHGRVWKKHEQKFQEYCEKHLTEEDTLVLVGDHSWGKNLAQAEADLQYICDLPGRKILTRGNHDMFWDAKKTAALNERYAGKLEFLQGNYYTYRDYALVGTKGFTFEGPFWIDRGNGSALQIPSKRQRRTDIRSSSCSCTTRLPACWRKKAFLQGWPRRTARQK